MVETLISVMQDGFLWTAFCDPFSDSIREVTYDYVVF